MKKKIIIITCGLILSAVLLLGAIPVAAADGPAATTTPPATQTVGNGHLWARILSVPDQATLDTLLSKAEANGKITADQAAKIETFWTNYHAKFVKVVKARVLQRLMNVKDEANLKAFLDKAVSAGKITAAQEASVISAWESAHSS